MTKTREIDIEVINYCMIFLRNVIKKTLTLTTFLIIDSALVERVEIEIKFKHNYIIHSDRFKYYKLKKGR